MEITLKEKNPRFIQSLKLSNLLQMLIFYMDKTKKVLIAEM